MAARRSKHELIKLLAYLLCVLGALVDPKAAAAASVGSWNETGSSEIRQRKDRDPSYLSNDVHNFAPPLRFKSSINGLLQGYTSSSRSSASVVGKHETKLKLLRSAAQVMPQRPPPFGSMIPRVDEYRCANYCSCSVIQVMDKSNEKRANMTQVRCESPQFTDLLTIDRQTHIIHISLPNKDLATDSNESPAGEEAARKVASQRQFRMPRLNQFNLLKEIVIINLQFEICDSEVFKKGQKMRRLQLNYNKLSRISKACLKHLDKLMELNLDYNQLSELESALFNSLLNLRSLSIAYNQLTELAAHQFANLTNLISLNLVGNSFKSINLQLFEPMQSSLRLLLLAKNQIKSFVQAPVIHQQTTIIIMNASASTKLNLLPLKSILSNTTAKSGSSSPFVGVVFKNLIKLNVDENKFERIKLLQLHRFFNVKYLSIRKNNIATIRDKAFNGLKLIELNLAHNQLQTVSKCAFCNATIKRLVLSYNNISQLPLPVGGEGLTPLATTVPIVTRPIALNGTTQQIPEPLAQQLGVDQASVSQSAPSQAISSPNMLILSQSIFGPLFGQLEYLDLSNNQLLASDQLELLLEPLLKLEYLNLAAVGLDRYLPSQSLFKNLRQLKYLNLSYNTLDQLQSETVESLTQLQVLDLSHNKFSEIEESFLDTIDDMTSMKVMNLGSNPWYCSQCKIAPMYDWILRSPLYNMTCIAPALEERNELPATSDDLDPSTNEAPSEPEASPSSEPASRLRLARGPQHYSLLVEDEKLDQPVDINLILANSLDDETAGHYNLLASDNNRASPAAGTFREILSSEDDPSIGLTMIQVSDALHKHYSSEEYCLKCEYPSELRSFNIHELQANDFKFCAGAAPRFSASEPKIGLTLAIVIIGALFCIIIIVIVMYRKKSNTYYTNEDTDQLDDGLGGSGGGKKPVFSISSDPDMHQYGDNTDYSSPPMSQSFDSYSQDEDRRDEDLDEEEEDEIDEEDEERDEDEDEEEEDEEEDDNNGNSGAGAAPGERFKHGKGGTEHHVGYASDIEQAQSIDYTTEEATAKRVAAAEIERHHQLAEYQKNDRSTPSGQRKSKSQGSGLTPADRSASGPIMHQRSTNREPAKRQSSAHHQHNNRHNSTKTQSDVAAAVATEKLTWPGKKDFVGSTTPSLSAALSSNSSSAKAGGGSGGSRSTGGRATRTPSHPAMSVRTPSGSQSVHSNSVELEVRVPTSKGSQGAAATPISDDMPLVNKHQQQRDTLHETKPLHKLTNPSDSRQHSSSEHQSSSQERKRALKTSQTSDSKQSRLKPQSSGVTQHQPAPSPGGAGPPLVGQPSIEPSADMPQHHHQSAAGVTGTNRHGRQRSAISKDQKSQPATEWAHLRPSIEPPAAPASLGVELSSLIPEASNGLHLPGSVGTLPAERGGQEAYPPDGGRMAATSRQPAVHYQATPIEQSRRPRSPSVASDATTADSLALEALSYTASELEEPPGEVGGALEMDSSGSFGPDEFVNNNNNNIINESSSINNNHNINNNNHHHSNNHQHQHHSNGSSRLQTGRFRMRESRSNHSALTQTSSRDEL